VDDLSLRLVGRKREKEAAGRLGAARSTRKGRTYKGFSHTRGLPFVEEALPWSGGSGRRIVRDLLEKTANYLFERCWTPLREHQGRSQVDAIGPWGDLRTREPCRLSDRPESVDAYASRHLSESKAMLFPCIPCSRPTERAATIGAGHAPQNGVGYDRQHIVMSSTGED
jgi:hypothetical protein